MEELINFIRSMTVDECKRWLLKPVNKNRLYEYWESTYQSIGQPKHAGEILYIIYFDERPTCVNGNHRTFKQFPKGYYNACPVRIGDNKSCQCCNAMRSASIANNKGLHSPEAIAKSKQTLIDRYGVSNPAKIPGFKDKLQSAFVKKYGQPTLKGVPEIREKIIKTNRDRYGVDWIQQSTEYQAASRARMLEKYGVAHAIIHPDVIEKRKKSMLARYGVENYFHSAENQEAIRVEGMAMYGYSNPGQGHLTTEQMHILYNKEVFSDYVVDKSYEHAARSIGVSATTVTYYANKYDLVSTMKIGYGSVNQTEIYEYLTSRNIDTEFNTRKIISPSELDIYIPSNKLAIEHNGVYHHSERTGGKLKDYHRNKYDKCSELGIDLIQVCSTVYDKTPDVVYDIISTRLKHNVRVFARNCYVNLIDTNEAQSFIDINHITVHDTSDHVCYGLYFNTQLIQVMTLTNGHTLFNEKLGVDEWELVNLITLHGYSVIGGASKLFNQFISKNNPRTVIAYNDIRYFTGNVFKRLGFDKIGEIDPLQWFTDYYRMIPSYDISVKDLMGDSYDPTKTDVDNLKEVKYDVIWDCGHSIWVWQNKEII